ncbi:MAG: cache domain-containing protein [Alphaproteobacteria bacterium]
MLNSIRNLKIGKRFLIINTIIVIGIVTVAALNLNALKKELLEDRIIKTEDLVDAATNTIKSYAEMAKSGEITVAEAKKLAINAVNGMRYDGDNYIWIQDYDLANNGMIAHPTKSLIGKNVSNMTDANGKQFISKQTYYDNRRKK